jgi:hypothetical protein
MIYDFKGFKKMSSVCGSVMMIVVELFFIEVPVRFISTLFLLGLEIIFPPASIILQV